MGGWYEEWDPRYEDSDARDEEVDGDGGVDGIDHDRWFMIDIYELREWRNWSSVYICHEQE